MASDSADMTSSISPAEGRMQHDSSCYAPDSSGMGGCADTRSDPVAREDGSDSCADAPTIPCAHHIEQHIPDTVRQCHAMSACSSQSAAETARLDHDSELAQSASCTVFDDSCDAMNVVSTVSPARRMFAAQVTVTRPRTPASPI